GHGIISTVSIKQMVDTVFQYEQGSKLQILSPILNQEKGTFKNKIEELKRQGYLRLRIDGSIYSLDDEIELEKTKKHNIDIFNWQNYFKWRYSYKKQNLWCNWKIN
ncbi:MAG: hypothetical protein K2J98_01965, partial [Malacoplasma sp.]|nr:hypothetical protein [Malacoplasma sp.]